MSRSISGFSKMSKRKKLRWIVENFFKDPENVMQELVSYWHKDEGCQKIFDGFSENTISNYFLPYGVAPNFVINGKTYVVPMVIEESSVVAAASSAAKFWMQRGGFQVDVLSMTKVGQVHFNWSGDKKKLLRVWDDLKETLMNDSASFTENMRKRGGGILKIELLDFTEQEPNYYQLKADFDTCDSMGANFINSILERFSKSLVGFVKRHPIFDEDERQVEIIMSILSNYTPECLVRAKVECPISDLGKFADGMSAETFAKKFYQAIRIAHIDPFRAATHNKGIFNGIDAVVVATANDFRAIEACGHTYAAKDGQYKSLSHCTIENGRFKFWIDLPIALGTVGGLTKLHPIAKRSLELLGNPDAEELMKIIASTGLAQNFAAIKSLVTTGIQKGHMKMHLANILNSFKATDNEVEKACIHFENEVISHHSVEAYLKSIRSQSVGS